MLQERTRFVGRGHNFSFLAHASFYVLRWAFGLALNIKPSGVWQQVALLDREFLGLTSLPSGLICKGVEWRETEA